MKKILITGASGVVGNKIFDVLSRIYDCTGAYFSTPIENGVQIDFTDKEYAGKKLDEIQPDIIINAMGEPSPDISQNAPERAKKLNVDVTQLLVDYAKRNLILLIHISSSVVFSGEKDGLYTESDPRGVVNIYGETKLEAEKIVESYENHIIVRFDFVFGYNGVGKKNGRIEDILATTEEIAIDKERMRQPMLTDDIAEAIQFLIEGNHRGIFHLGSELSTKYDLYKKLAAVFRKDNLIIPAGVEPNRPQSIAMDCSKIKDLGFKFKTLDEGIDLVKKQYFNNL